MYSEIIKKKMKNIAPDAEPMGIGKKAMEHAISSMKPKMEMEGEEENGEEEEKPKKGMMPEAKIEIELILESAKKKKGK